MPLVEQPFADTFTFSRAREAQHRDAGGELVTAGVDVPRFDHDETGAPRGLLVEGRPETSAADKLKAKAGDWEVAKGTVLHAYEDDAGQVQRRAWYAPKSPRSTVDACLNVKGRQRLIVYVPTYLPNRGGYVTWRGEDYALGSVLVAGPGVALGVSGNSPTMLLEG